MTRGTMKPFYYLAPAAMLAAATLAVRAQLPPVPAAPLPIPVAPTSGPTALPPLPVAPGSDPFPVVPPTDPDPVPLPGSALPVLPPVSLPPANTPPLAPAPRPVEVAPVVPSIPAPAPVPMSAVQSPILAPPLPAPVPVPVPAPSAPQTPSPLPLPTPTPVADAANYLILQDGKLVEGTVTVKGDVVVVRQGALDRPFPRVQVQFIGTTKDDVYRHVLGRVNADDVPGRLKVAQWCMFNGMREQALAEARELTKLQPTSTVAADMVRSLEESLRKFPPAGTAVVPPAPPRIPPAVPMVPPTPISGVHDSVPDAEPEVAPEAVAAFTGRVQPVLANLCSECHAKPDHPGSFKLARIPDGYDVGPQTVRQNLKAVAAQLKRDDPMASPLLVKAITAHGGMKLPAFTGRQAAAYQVLESWVAAAVPTTGPAVSATPAVPAFAVPPAAAAGFTPPSLPAKPEAVAPAAPTFGQAAPPVAPTGPADEFDPAEFNRPATPRK